MQILSCVFFWGSNALRRHLEMSENSSGEVLLGRFGLPVDRKRALLDERNQVAADRNRVVRILKAAQQEGMNAEPVILQHRCRDLLRSSDQARRIAGGAGGARDSHPQPLV